MCIFQGHSRPQRRRAMQASQVYIFWGPGCIRKDVQTVSTIFCAARSLHRPECTRFPAARIRNGQVRPYRVLARVVGRRRRPHSELAIYSASGGATFERLRRVFRLSMYITKLSREIQYLPSNTRRGLSARTYTPSAHPTHRTRRHAPAQGAALPRTRRATIDARPGTQRVHSLATHYPTRVRVRRNTSARVGARRLGLGLSTRDLRVPHGGVPVRPAPQDARCEGGRGCIVCGDTGCAGGVRVHDARARVRAATAASGDGCVRVAPEAWD